MYYIKAEIAQEVTIKAEITDENVFTTCPDCGVEHPVVLADTVDADGRLDLFGTAIYCPECSEKIRGELGEV